MKMSDKVLYVYVCMWNSLGAHLCMHVDQALTLGLSIRLYCGLSFEWGDMIVCYGRRPAQR